MFPRRAAVFFLFGGVAFIAVGCHGRERVAATQQLDGATPDGATGPFGPVRLITGLLDPADAIQDPTLTGDKLEMYFAADKAGDFDIWRTTRAAVDQPWTRATRVDELSTLGRDVEPEVSEDALTIYLSRDIGDYFHLFVAQRPMRLAPWGVPQLVNVGPPSTDHGPTIDRQGVTLVFSSTRVLDNFDLYLARRANQNADWEIPVSLTEINSEWQDWDPKLFRDGLGVAFGSRRAGDHLNADLFQSLRPTLSAPFREITPLTELNSPAAEGDPWLSNDGRHVIFASERDGFSQLYEAWR